VILFVDNNAGILFIKRIVSQIIDQIRITSIVVIQAVKSVGIAQKILAVNFIQRLNNHSVVQLLQSVAISQKDRFVSVVQVIRNILRKLS